jgi:hypothetical protein
MGNVQKFVILTTYHRYKPSELTWLGTVYKLCFGDHFFQYGRWLTSISRTFLVRVSDRLKKRMCKVSNFYKCFRYLCYFWEWGQPGFLGIDARIRSEWDKLWLGSSGGMLWSWWWILGFDNKWHTTLFPRVYPVLILGSRLLNLQQKHFYFWHFGRFSLQ